MTIYYPGAKISYNTVYKNENMTVTNEGPSSVVAFLPRLTPGGNVSINVSNFDSFYGSIVTTYDQGSNQFINPQPSGILGVLGPFYYRESLQSLILIALTFLSFVIAFRHKRRGRSKLASDILKDIMKVRKTYAVMGQTSNEIEIIYTSNNSSTLLVKFSEFSSSLANDKPLFSSLLGI